MITRDQIIKTLDEDMLTITLLLTEQCNFQCAHCFYSCGPGSLGEYMSQEVLTDVFNQIIFIWDKVECPNISVNLIGGEPTLNLPKFQSILSRVFGWLQNETISSIQMTTNGWWLHNEKDTVAFMKVISEEIPEDYLGLDGGVTIRVSNDRWHDEFRPPGLKGQRLNTALSSIWDEGLLFPMRSICYECNTEFKKGLFEDDDDCPIVDCGGYITISDELLTSYYLPDPSHGNDSDWIYVETHDRGSESVIPLGRGEAFGSNDKAEIGCNAMHGGNLCYKPDGTLHDICCSGSIFPAGKAADDPIKLLAMAMEFGKEQTSCHGCHEAAALWIKENAK